MCARSTWRQDRQPASAWPRERLTERTDREQFAAVFSDPDERAHGDFFHPPLPIGHPAPSLVGGDVASDAIAAVLSPFTQFLAAYLVDLPVAGHRVDEPDDALAGIGEDRVRVARPQI